MIYTITLTHTTPQAAGAALAEVVTQKPRAKCPVCGGMITTRVECGARMMDWHRDAEQMFYWCNGSDLNLSESEAQDE